MKPAHGWLLALGLFVVIAHAVLSRRRGLTSSCDMSSIPAVTLPTPPPMSADEKKTLRAAITACRASARKNPHAPKNLRQINAAIKKARAEARAEGKLPAYVD